MVWLRFYAQHALPFFALVWVASLDFTTRKWVVPKSARWRIWVFVLLPFVILLGKNMMVPAAHYTVAFVAMLVLALTFFWRPPLAHLFAKKDEYPLLRGILFFALVLAAFGSTPKTLQAELNKRLACRSEARGLHLRLQELHSQGKNIWVDPYTPYITNVDKSRLEVSWAKSWKGYEKGDWSVLALNTGFVSKFTGESVSDYTKVDIPDWEAAREFYLAFTKGDEARTPNGQVFKRVYQNSCSHELWVRQ